MDLLLLIVEGLVWLIDLTAIAADIHSWIKGKDNRIERRLARNDGRAIPPRDRWNRRVIGLTILVIVTTAALLLWKL